MKRCCGKWGQKLRNHGFKCTIPREAILEVLNATDDHLSPEDIYLKVHETYPNIGLTTVYRTLDMLEKLDLVIKLEFGDRRSRYELSEQVSHKAHHHHLICSKCGRIIDYSDFMEDEVDFLKKVEQELEKKHNFSIKKHVIHFYGTCDRCC